MIKLFALARPIGFGLLLAVSGMSHADEPGKVFNVRAYGATGDGLTLDTRALNQAIEACSKAGGGQVRIPPGRYLTGTIKLCGHMSLYLEAGARIIGTTNLDYYSAPMSSAVMSKAELQSWLKWQRGLIIGYNLEDVQIGGPGVIDGNKVFDPDGEEQQRGPYTINLVECRHLVIRDLEFVDSANYAIFFQATDDVMVRNVEVVGGWDGVHFNGVHEHYCRNVSIIDCQFFTGDDSVAGSYWDNVVIAGCTMNTSCNGLRLMGPARHLTVDHCLFSGPGQNPHRTSSRTNMLSGIILQPGAFHKRDGVLDDVLLSNNTMKDVAAPVTIWTYPNNTVGRITISGLDAIGVYRAAISAESWNDAPITNLVIRNVHIEFVGGGTAEQSKQAVQAPVYDCRSMPAWGIYLRNVDRVTVEDVRLSLTQDDFRPVIMAEQVKLLSFDNVRYSHVSGVTKALVTNRVDKLKLVDTDSSADWKTSEV